MAEGPLMSKRILITGGAGFIGAHTVEHILVHTDWDVVVTDALWLKGGWYRIEQVLKKDKSWKTRIRMIEVDLSVCVPGVPRCDYIVNMASESHVENSIEDPVPFIHNNVMLTARVLEYARLTRPDVFVQISTDEVYGAMYGGVPFKEWARILPSNPYSASKAAQEAIAVSYWRTYGVPLVITNTMNNIGEMQDMEKFVPKVIAAVMAGDTVQIHGTAEQLGSRFYLHARNHADALLFLLRRGDVTMYDPELHKDSETLPDRYNITGEEQIDNLAMAKAVAHVLNKELYYELTDFHSSRPGHDAHYGLDGSKIEALGWVPPYSLYESLVKTVENYAKHPEWLK